MTRLANQKDTRSFYGGIYNRLYRFGYHNKKDYSHAVSLCGKLLTNYRDRFESALDIGCSYGWAVRHLGEQGIRSAGVDVAEKAINRGVKQGLDLRVASATGLPFEDGAFDLVMSTDCFEHLRPEDVDAAVAEACRVARTTLAFKINPRVDRNGTWKLLAGTPLHLTTEPLEWWIGKFESHGCRVLDFDGQNEEFILARN